MSKDKTDVVTSTSGSSSDAPSGTPQPLTEAAVQRLIDAAFVKFEMRHGHLSQDDGDVILASLARK